MRRTIRTLPDVGNTPDPTIDEAFGVFKTLLRGERSGQEGSKRIASGDAHRRAEVAADAMQPCDWAKRSGSSEA